jgi:hypothetical protein
MKYVKMIGLVALAAMALMAVSAASASANAKVCSTTTGSPNTEIPNVACLSGHGVVYSGPISASLVAGTNAVLKATNSSGSTVTEVKCSQSTSSGTINGTTGSGSISTLTFGTCSSEQCPSGVVASSTGTPYAATATTDGATINTNGILDVTNAAGKFECKGTIVGTVTCSYTAALAQPTIDGSDTAPRMTASNIALARSGGLEFLCGAKADWTASYNVTTPSSLFVE